MDRRLFLLATAAMLGGGALPAAAAAPKAYILLVMARDCPWCMDWNAHDRPTFERLCRQSGAPVREVEVMRYSDIREASAWPEDLKPVLAQIRQTTGTPRFIIVRDGKIIQHAVGRRQYELGILPFIS
ncbi:hypothetical protein [Alsobacter sp. R-9]